MTGRTNFSAAVLVLGCALLVASCAQPQTTTPPPVVCGTGEVNQNGTCVCQTNLFRCNGACVSSDNSHCGNCTTMCLSPQVCSNNACGSSCAAGTTMCPSGCINTAGTDPTNCGGCGTRCPGGASCNGGSCSCSAGTICGTNPGTCCTGTCNNGTCVQPTGQAGTTGGGAGTTGAAGTTGGGAGTTGAAGTTGGGAGTTGVAGTTGQAGTTGTGGRGGTTGTAGTTGGAGTTGTGGGRACAPSSADVISDFEEGYAVMIRQGTPQRTGFWYTYNNSAQTQNQTPPKPGDLMADKMVAEPTTPCSMNAFHSSASGQDMYVGFGAAFLPAYPLVSPPNQMKMPYNVSAYDGIKFRARTGGGPASQPMFVEILARESQPAVAGGTATSEPIDLYNTRGQIVTVNSATYNTYYVPFGTLIPRWLPAVGASMACPAAGSGPKCQAAKFVPTNALGIQFSFYNTPGFPKPSPAGSYNMFIDDVEFYHRSATNVDLPALPSTTGAMRAFPRDAAVGGCMKPTGASGALLATAYKNWKDNFVVAASGGFRVVRPEVNNDTVSEGIAYGMLIAVYMNDKPLFDGLYTYWKANLHSGTPLMTWQIPGGSGTATDADEDAAFAMLMASKQWSGGTYAADALTLIRAVLSADMTGTQIKAGSNYGSVNPTNPSYFAPAFYRAFAAADTGNAAAWNGLANGAYTLLAAIGPTSSNGLFAAWCGNNCTTIATNSGSANPATDVLYQYDSHRIPWRIGMDFCWNGTAAAREYVNKTTAFFGAASRGGAGMGRIFDIYNPTGQDVPSTTTAVAVNSASIIGMAASGAMASNNAAAANLLNDGYQFVLDLLNRGKINELGDGNKSAYSYYNATVGMLALLTMSGNFTLLQ